MNRSCLNYYFCNQLWQKNYYNGSSSKENSPPLKGEPVPIKTQTQIGKPELKPEPEIAPEPEPTKSDQVREPAKSPVPVGLLVEYEGMSWSFTPSTGSKRWNANWLWEWVFSTCFSFTAPHFCVSAQPWISCVSAGSAQLWFTCVVRNPTQSKATQSFSSVSDGSLQLLSSFSMFST